MNTLKTTVAGFALATVASTAFAGGMDRSIFSSSILFEEGTVAQFTFGNTTPSIKPTVAPVNVAPSFQTVNLAYKHQFNDKLSAALIYNTNPFGVDISYVALGDTTQASLSTRSLTGLVKYQASDAISLYGGAKYQEVRGSAVLGGLPFSIPSGSGTGFIAGAAYEKKEIALRVALSYESKVDLDPSVTLGGTTLTGTLAAPEAITLEFQSGIAADTLVFGSIRHAKWSDADVILPPGFGGTNLSNFDDSTAYTLGLGRKISDSFSASMSMTYEKSTGEPVSALSPTDGLFTIGLGGKYTSPNGLSTSMGISLSKRGDAVTTGGLPFKDNFVTTAGFKISKSF